MINNILFKHSLAFSALAIVLLFPGLSIGQQVIGSFPQMDGGYENQSGTLANTLSASLWSRQSGTGSTISNSGGRSGPKYASATVAAGNRLLQSPQDAIAINGPAASTTYRVQFYYKSNAAFNVFQIGITINGTSSPTYSTGATLPSTSGVWTKYEGTVTTPAGTLTTAGVGIIRGGTAANGGPIDIDDYVIYSGSSIDNTAPDSPGTVTVDGATQTSLNVGWVAAGSVDGGGYVVIRYSSDPGTGNDPNQNGIYAIGNPVATGGIVRYLGTNTSFTDNIGLSPNTPYWYKVYTADKAFNYSAESSNSGTTASISGSSSSDIIGAGNEPSNIAYAAYQTSSITATSDAVRVFSFTIRDGGGSSDGDALPTILTSVTIDKGAGNGISSWANTLREAALFDGSTKIAEVSVSGEIVSFTGLSGENVTASDDGTKTLDLYVTFESTVTDNQQFQFQITNVNVTNAASGSSSFTTFAEVISSITGDAGKLEVTAAKLAFVQQPTGIAVNATISPAVTVAANDANNNRDLDYISDVALSATGSSLTGSPVSATPISGLATFSSLTLSIAGTGVSLNAQSGSLIGATSNTFDVTQPPVAGEIIINQFSPGYSAAADEYIELLNKTNKSFDLSLLKIEYQSAGGGPGSAGGNLTGTIGPYQYWLLSTNSTITVGLTTALARDGAINTGFAAASGQLALRLKNLPNTIIDGLAYGTITVNNLGEGTAAASPPSQGGLSRNPDGNDNNSNSADFNTVIQANINLRNHNSVNIPVPAVSTFTGTGNWSDLARWDNGIPGTVTDVSISGTATITDIADCNNCTLSTSGALTVNPSTGLIVEGNLLIQSGGSLITNAADMAVTGTTTVERTISGGPASWHLFITPITSSIPASVSSPFMDAYLDKYSESSGEWVRLLTDQQVEPLTGYSINFPAGIHTLRFSGTLHPSPVSFNNMSFTNSAPGYGAGWQLLGNPYPSGVNPAVCGIPDGINAFAYVWNGTNFLTYSLGSNDFPGTIASMQGFFVRTYSGTNSLLLDNVSKIHGGMFLKESLVVQDMLKLNVTGNGYSDKTYVRFKEEATTGFDQVLDAYKLFGIEGAPQLYSILPEDDAAVNTLPTILSNSDVSVGFKAGTAGDYTMTVTGVESFNASTQLVLEDLKTNLILDLRQTAVYNFIATPGDDEHRFNLHLKKANSIAENINSNVAIYSNKNSVYIKNPKRLKGSIVVYDLSSRLIANTILSGNLLDKLDMGNNKGNLIVKVISIDGVATGKVFVN
jgi:hypothetical protein